MPRRAPTRSIWGVVALVVTACLVGIAAHSVVTSAGSDGSGSATDATPGGAGPASGSPSAGLITPTPPGGAAPGPAPAGSGSPRPAASAPALGAAGTTALAVLATLPVRPAADGSGYQRTVDFGAAWIDVDRNGCDTRNDILARDLVDAVKRGPCTVVSGTLHDAYTGHAIGFVRGNTTSAAVQIDHLVALKNAWQTGAQQLTQAQRIALANDPRNLQAVDGHLNESKGDKDASLWIPPNRAYDCSYAARQIAVKKTYRLWVTPLEHDYLANLLNGCPGQTADVVALSVPAGAAAAVARYPGP